MTRFWYQEYNKLVSELNTIGDSAIKEDLLLMLREALIANEAQTTEIERRLGSQL